MGRWRGRRQQRGSARWKLGLAGLCLGVRNRELLLLTDSVKKRSFRRVGPGWKSLQQGRSSVCGKEALKGAEEEEASVRGRP